MKRWIPILLILALVFTGTEQIDAQSRKEKREAIKAQVMKNVESRRFKIRVTDSSSAREIARGGIDGSVEIIDTLLVSNLPYFGNVHGVQTDPTQLGLNFESPTYEYLSSVLYDGTAKVLFNARRNNENFTYYIEIKPQGQAVISVYSDRRSPASYTGEMVFK